MWVNRKTFNLVITACLTLWTTPAVYAAYNFQARCLAFKPEEHVHNSTLNVLTFVAAGTNLTLSDNDPTCNRTSQVVAVDLCRVALSIPTSNRSSISFELWLPDDWSGRLLATGNGGIDGCAFCLPLGSHWFRLDSGQRARLIIRNRYQI